MGGSLIARLRRPPAAGEAGSETAEAGKNQKLSQDSSVYSEDAVDRLREAAPVGDAPAEEEADRTAVAIAWRKNGPASSPPLSAVPGGGGSSGAVAVPVARSAAAAPMATDDDRGLTFEQIQKKYEGKIYSLILRYVGDREDAEDLTVETFVNAWRHWDRFRGEARIYTWLYQIAINNCKNRFKQRDRRREREPVSLDDTIETDSGEMSREVADWRNAPEQLLMDKEFAARVRKAIDALRPEYKEVFVLAEMEDMSYEDIARVTRLTVPAVKTRLHRARNMIRQRLEPYYRD